MFVVWGDGGVKTPYVPGSILGRRPEKIQKVAPVRKLDSHTQDSDPDPQSTPSSRATEAYQNIDSSSRGKNARLLAKEVMSTPVVTLPQTAGYADAWEIIRTQRFRHIPLLSAGGHLVGILSDRDLFRATFDILSSHEQSDVYLLHKPVQQIMVRTVLSASPETEIHSIARIFFTERIGAMPIVTERGHVAGILTRSDILRAVVNHAPFELWI